ncbi:MAG: hypothetical protein BWY59_01706 [Verrucomicrobia bacterium ADurb.Bin345]|nr:MAG: hypothetical protein BWY59_01706 [Verrucomicrobia bacterium ADurb.Bin345]
MNRMRRCWVAWSRRASTQDAWLQTSSAPPSIGTCSAPSTRIRYASRVTSSPMKRTRKSGSTFIVAIVRISVSAPMRRNPVAGVTPAAPRRRTRAAASMAPIHPRKALAASTSPRSCGGARNWMNASSGTMNRPAPRPATIMVGMARATGPTRHNDRMAAVRISEPRGTMPNSMLRPDTLPAATAPAAMPMAPNRNRYVLFSWLSPR